jgi:RHS repeat-associated protein
VIEANGDRVTWTYDTIYQLTHEQRSGANSYNITYTYDLTGNRTVMIDGGARTTYSYNAGNQQVTAKAAGGTTSYSYDANGNLAVSVAPGGGRTTTTWDVPNRPTKVLLPAGTRNTFAYDGDGRRVRKEDSSGVLKEVWDLENVLEETDGNDATQAVYTLGLAQFGDLVSQRRGGATRFFHFDALGSTDRLSDVNGTVTDSYLYKAFGIVATSSGSTTNPFRFVGRQGYYWDMDLSTYWLRARIYDPVTGRWFSEDPIGTQLGDANLYRYVGNNPENHLDPSGLKVELWCGPVASGVASGAVHCAVVVICNDRSIRFDGGGSASSGSRPNKPTQGKPQKPPGKPPATVTVYQVDSPWKDCENEVKCLQNAFNTITQAAYYVTGPNSNTYAHALLTVCTMKVKCFKITKWVLDDRQIWVENPRGTRIYRCRRPVRWEVCSPLRAWGWDTPGYYPNTVKGGPTPDWKK